MSRYRRLIRSRVAAAPTATYQAVFSYQIDADVADTFTASFTNPNLQVRWIVNGNIVDGNSISGLGSVFGLDGTPRTVEIQLLGTNVLTADRFTSNHVTGNINIANSTIGGLDLNNSPTLGIPSFSASPSFNFLDLSSTNIGYIDFTSLPFNNNNFFIDLQSNSFTNEEVARYLNDFDVNSIGSATGREITITGNNGFIYTGQIPYDGPTARTSLAAKGWTISVNQESDRAILTLNLNSGDTIDVSTIMSSQTPVFITPDGQQISQLSLSGTAGSYGFNGTPQDVEVVFDSVSSLSRLNVYSQKMSGFVLPNGTRIYSGGTIFDFGGNSAFISNNDALWDIVDRHGETLINSQDVYSKLNLRAADYDSINQTTGNWYFTRSIQIFLDTPAETWSFPTFPTGVTSSDVVSWVEMVNGLNLETDADDISVLIDHPNRILIGATGDINRAEAHGVGGKGVAPLDRILPENTIAGYIGYFDIIPSIPNYNAVVNRIILNSGTVIFDADQNNLGTHGPITMLDGGTPDLFVTIDGSDNRVATFRPRVNPIIELTATNPFDEIVWLTWDFPNNVCQAKTNSGELLTQNLVGYNSDDLRFSTMSFDVDAPQRYGCMLLNRALTEIEADTLLNNIRTKIY